MKRVAVVLAAAVLVGGLAAPGPAIAGDSFSASLDAACASPLGAQGLTVHTTPGDTVAWSTEYADHSNELTNPTYALLGGAGYAQAGADGVVRAEWRVPPQAPRGPAVVHLLGQGTMQPSVGYTVGLPGLDCPPA